MFDFEIPHESGNLSSDDSRNLDKQLMDADSDYFAAPEDSEITSSEEEETEEVMAVTVKQCQLKRARFQF